MDPRRSIRYTFSAGKRFCRPFFQNRKPRVAQSKNSATLIADIQKFKGIQCPFYPEGSLSIDLSGHRQQMKTEVSRVALWCYGSLATNYLQIPGPQRGTGSPAVAAWWLGTMCLGLEDTEAAAAPATTTESTRTRKASFITGYPLRKSGENLFDR